MMILADIHRANRIQDGIICSLVSLHAYCTPSLHPFAVASRPTGYLNEPYLHGPRYGDIVMHQPVNKNKGVGR